MKAILCAIVLMASFSIASADDYKINFDRIDVDDIENPGDVDLNNGLPMVGDFFTIGGTTYDGEILKTLIRTGQTINGETFGQVYDINNDPYPGWIHWALDFTGFAEAHGKMWMLNHWESRIGMLTLGELEQDPVTGELTVVSIKNLNFRELVHPDFHYISEPCSGSVTPWNSFLSSQEHPFDPKWFASNSDLTAAHVCEKWWAASKWSPYPHAPEYSTVYAYNGKECDPTMPLDDLIADFYDTYVNIYWNGIIIETEVTSAEGDVKLSPHFSMGRFSAEKPLVMPDRKTVYISEDRSTQCFWKFIADVEDDLSCGTLYAAKVETIAGWDNPENGILDFTWISLGHACDDVFTPNVIEQASLSKWFELTDPVDNKCPTGYTGYLVNNHKSYNSECIKLKDLTPEELVIASRLESQRYAAVLGATQEFSYIEGLDFDSDLGDRLYIGSAKVYIGMADGASDDPSWWDYLDEDHIQFAENSRGCVFQMILDNEYNGERWTTLKCGEEGGFKNPDNLGYVHGHDKIILCEDASRNGIDPNYVWAMDKTFPYEITPIVMGPPGAEMANGYTYHLGDFTYLVVVQQHPYEGSYADLPESCDPLGLEESCGEITGTGDWLTYFVWPRRQDVPTVPLTPSPTPSPTLPHITPEPTSPPTPTPTNYPTTEAPTPEPTPPPTQAPTDFPTVIPTFIPTNVPTIQAPTDFPTVIPTFIPTNVPTIYPTPTKGDQCVDDFSGATGDTNGDHCDTYLELWCGEYDDEDFNSLAQCCICGGGSVNGIDNYHESDVKRVQWSNPMPWLNIAYSGQEAGVGTKTQEEELSVGFTLTDLDSANVVQSKTYFPSKTNESSNLFGSSLVFCFVMICAVVAFGILHSRKREFESELLPLLEN